MYLEILIPILLMIVAFLYASVGHGGASGYIAVLTLCGVSLTAYKPVVLILNIVIASIAFMQFFRAGYFKWKLALPFLITSIPAAFIGIHFKVSDKLYNIILGIALLFPILRLVTKFAREKPEKRELNIPIALVIGAIIGFISGFLNIGGGIFLSPVLILLAWSTAKEAAAVSSLFIVCNSLSGLVALAYSNGITFTRENYIWLGAAIIGGIFGGYLGGHKYKQTTIMYVLSVVLMIAAFKLIFS